MNASFSIIIPVINEQGQINSVIAHIRSQTFDGDYEIIVVDGDPQGSTIKLIQDKDVVSITSQRGRARQMNAGADIARGRTLLFLHADTKLPPNALKKINQVLQNDKYVGGAFDLGVDSERWLIKAIAARARIRSHLTRIPYGDQAIFIRKEYFDKIGRFKDIPLMEDVELMRRIKRRGDKIFILRDCVITSPRRWEKEGVFYTTLRNMVLVTLYRFGVRPDKLARFYRNHHDESSP
ncbi:MAG: TIGR04283 family arsenosugar biosynthesis glycosyltransferase [Planctomycetota bacterium]|jgi:rSAM/selenodomain-associated transferase 2